MFYVVVLSVEGNRWCSVGQVIIAFFVSGKDWCSAYQVIKAFSVCKVMIGVLYQVTICVSCQLISWCFMCRVTSGVLCAT